MLKQLMDIWYGRTLLSRMTEDFKTMLRDGRWMFEVVTDRWIASGDLEEVSEELYDRDHRINQVQQRLRRCIVEHLAVNPKTDLPACLVLMSVVKDAERLGDYCKNLFEAVIRLVPEKEERPEVALLHSMRHDILEMFNSVISAFVQSDEEVAHKIIERNGPIAKECDRYVDGYLSEENPFPNVVAYALIFRYFKRISGHLTNIATSVVAPVDRLDYYDEDQGSAKEDSL